MTISTEDSEPRLMSPTASAMWHRRRYANDPAWREEKIERIILREKLRIKEDPIFRAKKQAQSAAFYAEKLEKAPYFKVLRDIRNWIDSFPAIRKKQLFGVTVHTRSSSSRIASLSDSP
ncbi:hypothetical protein D6D02_10629 [Aureobasidium pullulans]|nr:hypothetical protein D6D18_03833 [Aureobasidium pullulans]THX91143.1 hypothetical protein D6D02_10629 [Aureobasidium pullulans]